MEEKPEGESIDVEPKDASSLEVKSLAEGAAFSLDPNQPIVIYSSAEKDGGGEGGGEGKRGGGRERANDTSEWGGGVNEANHPTRPRPPR